MTLSAEAQTAGLEILRIRPPEGVARRAPSLVFLHGAFSGAWCWVEHFMPWFAARGYTCYAPSFRGHGGSAGHSDLHSFGIDDYVRDIVSVVEDLDGPPVLIGHSMGGFVGMRYLENHPARALILLASVPPNGLAAPAMSLALWNPSLWGEIAMIQSMDPSWASLDVMRDAMFSAEKDPEVLAHHRDMMNGESRRATMEMHGTLKLTPQSWKDRVPVLVLGANDDVLIRKAYVRSTARQLGRKAEFFKKTGHGMMLDHHWPDVAGRMAEWLWAQGL